MSAAAETDESNKVAMLKSAWKLRDGVWDGGAYSLYLEAKSEVAEALETLISCLCYQGRPWKPRKSELFSEPPSENNSGEVGLNAMWAKER